MPCFFYVTEIMLINFEDMLSKFDKNINYA